MNMSTSPSASAETPFIVPKRRSRRIWLFALVGIVVLATSWGGFVVLDSLMRSREVALYAKRMQRPLAMDGVSQTFVNQQSPQDFAQKLHTSQANPFTKSPLQDRLQPRKYYANPIQPQDPAEASATNEINQLSNQLRTATGEQSKELRKSLNEAVGKLFDLRHAAQAKQVEKLEAELAEAKELLKKRSERKDEIVDRRIAELLQSADDLAWNRAIAGQTAPTTNNPRLSFSETTEPSTNSVYVVPPSGSYPNNSYPNNSYPNYPVVPNPYGTAPNYSTTPGTLYSNPVPPSSTPPQLIPMSNQDSSQTSLLQNAPSSNDTAPTNSAPSAPTVSSTNVSPSSESVAPSTLPLLNARPEDAVQLFLASLQEGSPLQANQLLTSKAREQLAKAEFQLAPLGSPEASYKIGRVGYPNEEKNVALVEAVFTTPGQPQPLDLVFEVAANNGSWFIAGMAIKLNDQTVAIDFEDAASLNELTKSSTAEADISLSSTVEIVMNNAKRQKPGAAGEINSQPMETQPLALPSKSSSTSLESSKAVIEAAYAYEEALQLAVEGGLLWKKGLTNSNEYSSLKRKAAKAKAIWAAIGQDLEARQEILNEEISGKVNAINESQSKSKREELMLELSKLKSEIGSLMKTKVWAKDFEKQSLESLEKQLEQSDGKKAETKADTKAEE